MLRQPPKHPLTRMFLVLSAVIFASCLAAASHGASSSRVCAGLVGPTNFDYLVLASIADSPRLLAMAGYRSMAMQHALHPPGAELTTVSSRYCGRPTQYPGVVGVVADATGPNRITALSLSSLK